MSIVIKKMETREEILGKAFVHWASWHETYPGLISKDYLEKLSLEKCEAIAFQWPDHILIAKASDKVIGFVGYGIGREEPEIGEIFALYVLAEFHGRGVGQMLLSAGLKQLSACNRVNLWVIENNDRAIRFYEKNGFSRTTEKLEKSNLKASVIRMTTI